MSVKNDKNDLLSQFDIFFDRHTFELNIHLPELKSNYPVDFNFYLAAHDQLKGIFCNLLNMSIEASDLAVLKPFVTLKKGDFLPERNISIPLSPDAVQKLIGMSIYIGYGENVAQMIDLNNYRVACKISLLEKIELSEQVSSENFDEYLYFYENPDVHQMVKIKKISTGYEHFSSLSTTNERKIRVHKNKIADIKNIKRQKIKSILKKNIDFLDNDDFVDCLPEGEKSIFNFNLDQHPSQHGYDLYVSQLIESLYDGLILDCGAGKRPVYYSNVVNFEPVDYDSTDVRGLSEELPFVDNAFDAVLSLSVLEHVKNPFLAAQELIRVLKPGGKIICVAPFLQPFHAYPNHYFNMTPEGLKTLFQKDIVIDKVFNYGSLLPISTLTWMIHSWANGLSPATKQQFLNMRLMDLIHPLENYSHQKFVTELSPEKNLELGCATALFGTKALNS